MAGIHPSAVIEAGAVVPESCTIGPFCIVGPNVALGENVVLKSHVVVTGDTQIGDNTVVFPFSVLGEVPQDLKYDGEKAVLRIGSENTIREHVTMNIGTSGGGGETRIGNGGLFMAGCHVAHDVQIGDRVILVNSVALAGHCVIEDDVIVGGLSGVHQWVRIGQGAIIGALSMVTHDVIPHGLVMGPRGELDGLNLVGLKRKGVPRQDITALRAAFLALKDGDGTIHDRAERIGGEMDSGYVKQLVDFVLANSDRGLLTPR